MDLYECIDLQRGPRLNLIQWLQQRSLLANPLICAQCNRDMELKERNGGHIDGFLWQVKQKLLTFISINHTMATDSDCRGKTRRRYTTS